MKRVYIDKKRKVVARVAKGSRLLTVISPLNFPNFLFCPSTSSASSL